MPVPANATQDVGNWTMAQRKLGGLRCWICDVAAAVLAAVVVVGGGDVVVFF